jgi:hypothetical protein
MVLINKQHAKWCVEEYSIHSSVHTNTDSTSCIAEVTLRSYTMIVGVESPILLGLGSHWLNCLAFFVGIISSISCIYNCECTHWRSNLTAFWLPIIISYTLAYTHIQNTSQLPGHLQHRRSRWGQVLSERAIWCKVLGPVGEYCVRACGRCGGCCWPLWWCRWGR